MQFSVCSSHFVSGNIITLQTSNTPFPGSAVFSPAMIMAAWTNLKRLPSPDEIDAMLQNPDVQKIMNGLYETRDVRQLKIHSLAQRWIEKGEVRNVLGLLMLS